MKYNEHESLNMFLVELEKCFSQLEESGNKLTDEEKINYILMSMPKSYDNVVSAIETIETLEITLVKNRLLGEE